MCFSATASFTAAGVLGVVGAASVHNATRKQKMYAAIPLIFAAQQAIEGFLWHGTQTSPYVHDFSYGFLFVAFVLWPLYVPVSVWKMQQGIAQKRIVPLIGLGAVVSVFFLAILLMNPLTVLVGGNHISYIIEVPFHYFIGACYFVATCGSMLLSSHRWVKISGLATGVALAIAFALAYTSFGSVWCFLSAGLSVIVYAHIWTTNKMKT